MSNSLTRAMQDIVPLSDEDRNEIDNLLASVVHGDARQKTQARASLQAFREASDAHQTYIAEQQAADTMIDGSLDALRRLYDRRTHISPDRRRRTFPGKRRLRVGAVFGNLALGAAAAIWMINPVLSQQDSVAQVGQQTRLVLDDGSQVLLNTGTAIQFSNRLRSREAKLVRGEALFTVAHRALRPFQLRAGSAEIHDIGTQFSVRLVDPAIDVAVLEGEVAVKLPGQGALIQVLAGQAVRTDGVRVLQRPRVGALVEWKDRRLDFNHTPLSEVVRELQRYRTTPIVLADARAGEALISGGFSSADPDRLLKTIPFVAPVKVSFDANGTARIASR
ncbi:FecR domain-containing protein [Burkholderia sp. FERM BP-3421]|uniref:FecR family protein n=1 Tax=Burkholderia sp. FERM BP-3421 TaxID=1494466 RepID=UPI0023616AA3|nr:FecR domain-containing protein [Burkholderia sp. FERM BP-3421]WDD92109.1 FecR domain-containing protein [Burkholderia sp. FERM BP-3421]